MFTDDAIGAVMVLGSERGRSRLVDHGDESTRCTRECTRWPALPSTRSTHGPSCDVVASWGKIQDSEG